MASKTINPYSVELVQSGNPNLLYATSSDGYTVYAVYFASPTEVTCTCAGFEKGFNCRHRKAAMFRFQYVPELDPVLDDVSWARIKRNIEREAIKDDMRDLFGDNWTGPLDAA